MVIKSLEEDNPVVRTGCRMCEKGFIGVGELDAVFGSQGCGLVGSGAVSKGISNCEFYGNRSGYPCWYCKKGFVVGNGEGVCESWSIDPNCRMLHGSGDCNWCFDAYYWDGNKCHLKGGLSLCWMVGLFGVYFGVIGWF